MMKKIIGLAVLAVLAFALFQAGSFAWGLIFGDGKAQSQQQETIKENLIVNSFSPQPALDFSEEKEAEKAPEPSEKKKQVLELEEKAKAYSELFKSAELMEMEKYEGSSVN